ncbi:MAG TPA: class I SAM-dependent methyltransferase [Acidimicrobiales bacterium]|jgi:SAM-dependent methyltransferase
MERRLVFGEDAPRYDRARPTYPSALIDDLVDLLGAHARVIDVGTGTAKGTRLLAERGMTGVGVEAHPAMAAEARQHLARYPGWRVDVSDFEDWTPTDGDAPADLVSSAQAWHWVDPAAGLATAHGLLRPGGWIALWWNLAEEDPQPIRQEIDAAYEEIAPGELFSPQIRRDEASPFDDAPAVVEFRDPTERLYRWNLTYTTAELLDLISTHSNHQVMPAELREQLLDAVATIVDRHGGTYDYPYVTRLWSAQRV